MKTTEIITLIIAFGGWLLAILQYLMGYYERKKSKNDEILLRTVDYFTGGSQKRSVGISLIEGLIKDKNEYYEIIAPLLANQFVYLLLVSDSEPSVHEERNLVRIFFILKKIFQSDRHRYADIKNEILDAILRRKDGEKSSINISLQTLEIWKQQIQ
jgi:hypothetical protein